MRILVGGAEAGRQLHDLAEGFKVLGHETKTLVANQNPFYPDLRYDWSASPTLPSPLLQSQNALAKLLRVTAFQAHGFWARLRALSRQSHFDLFVFQFGWSLLPSNLDYRLLTRLGKHLVCTFLGSDIRHWLATEQARELHQLSSYVGYRDDDRSIDSVLRTLRKAELYANRLLLQPSYGELAIRPYNHLYLALDLYRYDFNVPGRSSPLLIHAPSRRRLKGTERILEVLAGLRKEGHNFELRVLENLPNSDITRALTEADVVLDEIGESHYGMLGLEGMATGCAVAGGNRPDVVPIPNNIPVFHLSPENLETQLRELISNRDLRIDLATRGRVFAETHHQNWKVAERITNMIENPEASTDYQPTFFLRDFSPPAGMKLSRHVKKLTTEIVRQHGLPWDVEPEDVSRKGLMKRTRLPIHHWPPPQTS